MQEKSDFRVVNIREYLDSDDPMLGEDFLKEMISKFSCPKNPEVERFLKRQAIDFAKKVPELFYSLSITKGIVTFTTNFCPDQAKRCCNEFLYKV